MKQDKHEKVIVNIRIRPFTQEETVLDKTTPIEAIDVKTNSLLFKRDLDTKPFTFDRIFPINSTQEDIFNSSAKGVIDVFDL